jgi:integrase
MVQKKAPTARFNFTVSAIDKLPSPASGRVTYHDEGCDNLSLVVSPASKSFYWSGRSAGRPTRLFVGKFPEMGVENARKKTRRLSAARDEGRDPAAERKAKRKEPTLAELWESFLELHARPQKKSWKEDERKYKKYLATLHDKRLSAITQPVVVKWHSAVGKEHGPILANRCKALLATMFSKASAAVGYSGPNPAVGVANFPERSRERFLLPAEMSAFFTALAAEDVYWQGFFLLCLFTGSRRGNIASMEWGEVDLEGALWHTPGSKTKNKRPTTISLCAPALAILKTRHEQRNGILAASSLADLHMHDLRRTQGSWQAAMGISLAIIGKSLGHADLKSTQVYSRLQLDPVKDAVSRASGAMVEAAGIQIGGSGVELVVTEKGEAGDDGK